MSKKHSLKAEERNRSGSAALKQMRREGLVPAVIYGAKQESTNLKVNAKAFSDMMHSAASDQILVDLDVEGAGNKLALIQDIQQDALSGNIIHIDFHAVSEDEMIRANVPITLVGEAIGVKTGGLLEQLLHSMEINCLPNDLPEGIEVDVTELDKGEPLKLESVVFPDGVTPSLEGGVVVALVAETRTEKSEKAGGEAEAAEGTEGEAAEGEPKEAAG